eukprot:1169344-Prymnesium_polylepis.1
MTRRSGGRFPGLCKNDRRKEQNVPTMGGRVDNRQRVMADAADCGPGDVSLGPPPANRLELLRRRGNL